MARPDKTLIEPRFRKSIERWIHGAIHPGDFLGAVLRNDLLGAMERGDDAAIDNLPHIVSFLYLDCPSLCWGSNERVVEWPRIFERVLDG